MLKAFNGTEVTVRCPHCGNELRERAGALRNQPMLTCLSCGKKFRFESGLGMALVQEAIGGLRQRLGRLMGRSSA